jgi:16S rRNA (adenine1518-N6/adenine1519-N6)-dimethyltransferase
VKAKKSLGQHFLIDGSAIRQIVDAAKIGADDLVIEIGPGRGALTGLLVKQAAQVLAIEIDEDMCHILRRQFANDKNFSLVAADVQLVDLCELVQNQGFSRAILVGNLPYHITGILMRQILSARDVLSKAVIMVQREVARRITAKPGNKDYGVLTTVTQINCVPQLIFDLPPSYFEPPPKVHSSVLRLQFDGAPQFIVEDQDLFLKVVHASFQQRRKMLRNTLRSLFDGNDDLLIEILQEAGVDATLRPEAVPVGQFELIARAWDKRR